MATNKERSVYIIEGVKITPRIIKVLRSLDDEPRKAADRVAENALTLSSLEEVRECTDPFFFFDQSRFYSLLVAIAESDNPEEDNE